MKRRLARELAIQSLYYMAMNEATPEEALSMVMEEAMHERETEITEEILTSIRPYVSDIVEGTMRHKESIDRILEGYLKRWKVERLSKVDLQILRLAVFEMVIREEVPPKVVINEAIELAKWFGTEESGKFINGVLGKMFKELDEIKAKSK